MIVSMKLGATKEQIERVCNRIEDMGFQVRSIQGDERIVIAAVGVEDVTHGIETMRSAEGVESAVPISAPYKLVSKQVRQERTVVAVGDAAVGGSEFAVFAGPCSVETEQQINACAETVAAAGAKFLRGGAYKPRSSPYSFQGLEEAGLKLLRNAADSAGLKVVTEVMTVANVNLVAEYADVLQVGARNVQNFPLLKEIGASTNRPVLLKRGLSTTIKELLLSAEYIVSHGNANVILCERGIRTFENATRNTLDINAVPGAERDDPPSGHSRPRARDRKTRLDSAVDPRRGRGRRRRHHGRNPPGSATRLERRRPIAYVRAVRRDDARPRTLRRTVGGRPRQVDCGLDRAAPRGAVRVRSGSFGFVRIAVMVPYHMSLVGPKSRVLAQPLDRGRRRAEHW